jgi:hypothetical protein
MDQMPALPVGIRGNDGPSVAPLRWGRFSTEEKPYGLA